MFKNVYYCEQFLIWKKNLYLPAYICYNQISNAILELSEKALKWDITGGFLWILVP
ncbi:hypothetical protein HMPREF1548_06184 [Clostridium sp. KLE 1755]|nr:hypothetical protein HMPREF1548_06184 [Clostridium sp. KLE 1755]